MDLSIIIVNWNSGELLRNCITSINEETKNINYEIIVCDNDSSDGSADLDLQIYKNVNVIFSKENLGFSKGNNLAIERAKGKYILLLNPDTVILDSAIDKAYKFIVGKSNVLLGVKLLNSDKSIQISSCKFPTVINLILGNHAMNIEEHKYTHNTDWVMGAFMMIDKLLYEKVGKLDEGYFMYSEDVDLCYQVKKNGGEVIYLAESSIIHFYNQSGSKKWNSRRDKVVTQSFIMFINKNYSGFKRIIYRNIINMRYFVKMIFKKRK